MISSSAPLFVLFLFVFRVCLSDDSPSTGGLDSPMLALVRAVGRSRPFGRCREASHVSTGDFEAKIQRDNDASSITDLSSSLQNEGADTTTASHCQLSLRFFFHSFFFFNNFVGFLYHLDV